MKFAGAKRQQGMRNRRARSSRAELNDPFSRKHRAVNGESFLRILTNPCCDKSGGCFEGNGVTAPIARASLLSSSSTSRTARLQGYVIFSRRSPAARGSHDLCRRAAVRRAHEVDLPYRYYVSRARHLSLM